MKKTIILLTLTLLFSFTTLAYNENVKFNIVNFDDVIYSGDRLSFIVQAIDRDGKLTELDTMMLEFYFNGTSIVTSQFEYAQNIGYIYDQEFIVEEHQLGEWELIISGNENHETIQVKRALFVVNDEQSKFVLSNFEQDLEDLKNLKTIKKIKDFISKQLEKDYVIYSLLGFLVLILIIILVILWRRL